MRARRSRRGKALQVAVRLVDGGDDGIQQGVDPGDDFCGEAPVYCNVSKGLDPGPNYAAPDLTYVDGMKIIIH